MKSDIDLPRKPMLLIAALQGIWLMLLYQATDAGSWPSKDPVWSFPLWTLGLATPVLLLLSLDKGNTRSVALQAGAFSTVLAGGGGRSGCAGRSLARTTWDGAAFVAMRFCGPPRSRSAARRPGIAAPLIRPR